MFATSRRFQRAAAAAVPLVIVLALTAAGGCGPAGDGGNPDGGGHDGDHTPQGLCQLSPRPTYNDIWNEVFKGCATSGCHADGAGGMRFTNPDEFLAATLRRPSSAVPAAFRIQPGVPDKSFVYQRLLETASPRMPMNGPYLSDIQQLMVAGWICGGAIDDRNQFQGDGGDDFHGDGGREDIRGDGGVAYGDGGEEYGPDGGHDGEDRGDGGEEYGPDGGEAYGDGGMDMRGDGGQEYQGGPDGGGFEMNPDGGGFQPNPDGGGFQANPDGGGFQGDGDGGTAPSGPVVNAFDPRSGLVGSRVNIHGNNFGTDVRFIVVKFTGNVEAPIDSAANGELAVLVPDGARTGPISVTVRGVTATSGDSYEVIIPNPAPKLTAISPASAAAGSGATPVTLTGTGFIPSSQVLLDGNAITSTYVSATTLTATFPAATAARGGTHPFSVQNPTPGGGYSTSQVFTVTNPVPDLTALAPAKALVGSAETTVALTGTGFTPDTTVQVNGASVGATVKSGTAVDAVIPAQMLLVAGSLTVTAFNPGPGGGNSGALAFSVENPAPTATQLAPTSLEVGATTRHIAIVGTNFIALSRVLVDGVTLPTTVVSGTRIEADVEQSTVAAAGTHQVTVRTPGPGGGTTSVLTLTVTNPAPTLTLVEPATGPTGATNVFVRVTGTKFTAASTVRVNGTDAPTSNVLDATSIIANMPPIQTPGDATVTVFTPGPGGGTSNPATFTYVDSGKPTISALSPARPASNAAFTLTIDGSHFGCTAGVAGGVKFNGVDLAPLTCTATQVTVTIPSSPAGTYPVRVSNAAANTLSDPAALTIFDPRPVPVLTSISPTLVGTSSQPVTLTLTGTGFAPDATVAAGSTTIPATITDAGHATASVPASLLGSPGSLAITVFNPGPGGGTSAAKALQVVTPNPVPSISAVTPATIGTGSTDVVLHVTGTGFSTQTTASWDTFPRAVTFLDATHVDVALQNTDVAQAGAHDLVVSNPAPGGGSSSAQRITVVPPNPPPGISALSITNVAAGIGGATLDVDGTSFVTSSVVRFNGSARATTFKSATKLGVALTAADVAVAGTFPITVFNPAPGGGTSNALTFTVNNPIPTADSLSPATIEAGSAAFTLTVNGASFTQTSVVRVGGVSRTTRFMSATQLAVDVPGADVASAGTVAITVFNPAPGGGSSGTVNLTVTNPKPTVTAITPCGVVAGGSGTLTLTLTGTGFVQGMSGVFGSTFVSASVTNANTATITVPPALYATAPSSRTVPVAVATPAPGGGTSSPKNFGIASRAVNFVTEIQNGIFNQRCTGCHGGSGGLFLDGDARTALVGVDAPEVAPIKYVEACEPSKEHSFIVDKLMSPAPAGGSQMPLGGPYISNTELQTLQDWIAAGAK